MRFILLCLFLTGCGLSGILDVFKIPEPEQKINDFNQHNYRRDMWIQEGSHKAKIGAVVLDHDPFYTFHIKAPEEITLFTMVTCHREWSREWAWNVTQEVCEGPFCWWKRTIVKKTELKFRLTLDPIMEHTGDCDLQLGSFSKTGQHSFGWVGFKHPKYKLEAYARCNGTSGKEAELGEGVGVCQAREGLKKRVTFPVEVIVSPDVGCELGATRGKSFDYYVNKGDCTYIFREVGGERRELRYTVLGYEKILIRE